MCVVKIDWFLIGDTRPDDSYSIDTETGSNEVLLWI
jgi:hypothetical protein